jgi:cyclopropane fatty-acyl-phospholipid synthase-like methyltransferase
VEYTGIDIESALVQHGRKLLMAAGHRTTRLIRADLKDDAWTAGIGPFDAVFSLQTFHDLGGIEALETVYRQIRELLAPGGILINADFVIPFEKDDPERPRRLPVETHKDLLSRLGFIDFRCELQQGKMACMAAGRSF